MAAVDCRVDVGARRGVPESTRFAWTRLLHIMRPSGRSALCGAPILADDVFPCGQGFRSWDEFPSVRCPTCESRSKVASC